MFGQTDISDQTKNVYIIIGKEDKHVRKQP